MKELVIISGKGGTGKTSVTASFAHLAESPVLADCDVDAADLHILTAPAIQLDEEFRGGVKAEINRELCTECGACTAACRYDAITDDFTVDPVACEGCGVCFHVCPAEAVTLREGINGRWYISNTRFGPMVHAALLPGEENSGKLVALVRNQAKVLAEKEGRDLILVDGAPGVGCPVISSVTGADHVLVITEPTLSGAHDLERALQLVRGFNIPVCAVINKADINEEMTAEIEAKLKNYDAPLLGTIPYDPSVTTAMVNRKAVVENGDGPAKDALLEIWERVRDRLTT
jgi:MinD superfamily P-loop ATPase